MVASATPSTAMTSPSSEHRIALDDDGLELVSALFVRPPDAEWLYVMAHGAGAGMRHGFMAAMSEALALRRIATLRYQFPYMEAGRRRPDPAGPCERTVRAAVRAAAALAPDLPLAAGGKSMGGRMTSQTSASAAGAAPALPGVHALIFLGFPLHPAPPPATRRAEHLARVALPMLFLQGDRDALADLTLLRPIVNGLPNATLITIAGADHGFAVSRKVSRDVPAELATHIAAYLAAKLHRHLGIGGGT